MLQLEWDWQLVAVVQVVPDYILQRGSWGSPRQAEAECEPSQAFTPVTLPEPTIHLGKLRWEESMFEAGLGELSQSLPQQSEKR